MITIKKEDEDAFVKAFMSHNPTTTKIIILDAFKKLPDDIKERILKQLETEMNLIIIHNTINSMFE